MSENWYFKTLGSEFGPIPFDELEKMLQSGELSPTDEVRAESSTEWKAAQTLNISSSQSFSSGSEVNDSDRNLVENLLPHAAEIEEFGSLDEIVLDNEDDHTRQAASLEQFMHQHTQPQISSMAVSRKAEDDFELDETVPTGELADWYAKVLEIEMGPLSHLELQTKISQGIIGNDDLIRQGTHSSWKSAKGFSEFNFPEIKVPVVPAEPEPVAPEKLQDQAVEPPSQEKVTATPPVTEPVSKEEVVPEPQQEAVQKITAPVIKSEGPKSSDPAAPYKPDTKPAPKIMGTKSTPQKNKPAIMPYSPPVSRSRVSRFDWNIPGGENLKFVGIFVAVLGVVYLGYLFMFADPGVKYYHQLTDLWERTKIAYDADPVNFKNKSGPFKEEADAIMKEMGPIPNTSSPLFAAVKSFGKDGIIPFLTNIPSERKKKSADGYLKTASYIYNQ